MSWGELELAADALDALELQAALVLSHMRSVLRSGRAWRRCPRYSEPWVRALTAHARAQQSLQRALQDWAELYELAAPMVGSVLPGPDAAQEQP